MNCLFPDVDDVNDADFAEKLEWLYSNKEPWSKCTTLWKETSKQRRRLLQKQNQSVYEYMGLYSGLKDRSGYLLVRMSGLK